MKLLALLPLGCSCLLLCILLPFSVLSGGAVVLAIGYGCQETPMGQRVQSQPHQPPTPDHNHLITCTWFHFPCPIKVHSPNSLVCWSQGRTQFSGLSTYLLDPRGWHSPVGSPERIKIRTVISQLIELHWLFMFEPTVFITVLLQFVKINKLRILTSTMYFSVQLWQRHIFLITPKLT